MKCKFLLISLLFLFLCSDQLIAALSKRDSLSLLLSKAESIEQKVMVMEELGYLVMERDLEAALTYATEIIQLAENSPERFAEDYYAIGARLFLAGNVYDLAYEAFLKSLKISEKLEHRQEVCVTRSNIGGVYLKLSKFDEALAYFKKSLEEAEVLVAEGNMDLAYNMCAFYNNVGLTYGKMGKDNVAITYLEKAIELVPADLPMLLARYYFNIAQLYYNVGEREKAFDCIDRSKKYWITENNERMLAYCEYQIASFYFSEKNLKEAENYLKSALEYSRNTTSRTLIRDIYTLFIEVCKGQGNYKKANDYLEGLYEVKESLVNDDILMKVTTLKLEYDFDKKLTRQELDAKKREYRYNLILTISVMLIIILCLFTLVVRYKIKQVRMQKDVLERDLELRNQELTTNVMYLMKNADMVKEVLLRLMSIKENLKPENLKVIKEIISDLQALTRNDLWSEFEVRFNRVHIDFYKNLQESFPDLTPAELKLCAFLRLNMSSKEISSLTGITPKSVDVMRARIRKKININNTDVNLVTFLAEF